LSKTRCAIVALLLFLAALWALTPPHLKYVSAEKLPVLPDASLIADAEERIMPAEGNRQSPWVIVALHGFSASRQETAPLAETVARRLGAPLIEARFSGHGLTSNRLKGVLAEHWLNDVRRVLTRAGELGDKLVVIGTSTGATAAAAILDQDIADRIDTLVMISPNFEPRDPRAKWLTRPAGPLLARVLAGDTRCWTPHNELQERFWTTCYPTIAAVQMMRLVDRANRILPADISQRLLMFYSRDDEVVSAEAALRVFDATGSPMKVAIEIRDPGDPSHHVLAGDILSPLRTQEIADAIVGFIERPVP